MHVCFVCICTVCGCAHCIFGCECMTELLCLQVHVCLAVYSVRLCSSGVLRVEGYMVACVWRARVERRAMHSMSMSRCGYHSRRATNPVTTRGRTLLANMG
uniref:Secreted protein n=1 Tax=Seriola lalandi dorsalis TaxID=1841481 RepID=A0A3B4XD43_SERLL